MLGLDVSQLTVHYGAHEVLHGINLSVPRGELLALVGPSGCGKTTALRTIAGLERASSGRIEVSGQVFAESGRHVAPEKRGIGWVPQHATLFPHLTVAQNVAFGLKDAHGSRRTAKKRVADPEVARLLELVELSEHASRLPAQLSGGQAQRVALARALAAGPEVVLLDEPFGALDPLLRVSLRDSTRNWLRAEGVTGVLVTHDQSEALSVADQVAVMHDGHLLQQAPPTQLFGRPATPWVAGFVGDAAFLDAHVVATGGWCGTVLNADSVLGRLPAHWMGSGSPRDGQQIQLMVRPAQVTLAASGIPGRVVSLRFTGYDVALTIELPSGVRVPALAPAAEAPEHDATVHVRVAGQAVAYPAADA